MLTSKRSVFVGVVAVDERYCHPECPYFMRGKLNLPCCCLRGRGKTRNMRYNKTHKSYERTDNCMAREIK